MVPQHDLGRADTDVMGGAVLKFLGHPLEVAEERFDELVQLLASLAQDERTPLKKLHAQKVLKRDDLSADRRLLDAVGDVANGFRNALVPRDVVKQLQVMNIH